MIRVLFIGAVPPPYHGVAVANDILLRGAAHHPELQVLHLDITDRRPISTVEKFDWGNVRAALIHGWQCWGRLLRDKPDVVYLSVSQKTLGFLRDCLFLLPARWLNRPLVVHLHGGNLHKFYREASPPLRFLLRYALARTARAIVLGECLRECFDGLVPPDRVVVVPNGIPDFAANWKHQPHTPLRVLYLGTVSRAKGIEIFLRAAQALRAEQAPLEFRVAGPWYSEQERKELTSLCEGIEFLGEVTGETKERAWRQADVFVFPSLRLEEGLPLVVLEAMCAGLPVIATDRGCSREVVQDGKTGYLIAADDVAAVIQRLRDLARDPARVQQMGLAGRRRYEAEYRAERFVERMIDAWKQAAQVSKR